MQRVERGWRSAPEGLPCRFHPESGQIPPTADRTSRHARFLLSVDDLRADAVPESRKLLREPTGRGDGRRWGGRMSSLRSVARLVLGAFLLFGIAVAPARADKCTGAKLKAIGKKESGLLGCQAKVAATNDSSGLSACEMKVKGKCTSSKSSAPFGRLRKSHSRQVTPRQATRRFSCFLRASVARLIRARRSRIAACRPAYMSAGVTFCRDSCSRRWL